jgi:hypothetical protein
MNSRVMSILISAGHDAIANASYLGSSDSPSVWHGAQPTGFNPHRIKYRENQRFTKKSPELL